MIPPLREATQNGYDLQFGTNVVAHFYLTELLMPALLAGVASSPDRHARVVTTTSSAAYLGKLRYDTLKDGPARMKSSRDALYTQSKLVSVSFYSSGPTKRSHDLVFQGNTIVARAPTVHTGSERVATISRAARRVP